LPFGEPLAILARMIITTMNELPGYAIDEVLGEVLGLTVRSRNVGSLGTTWTEICAYGTAVKAPKA
jgi:uncharacterized protein YbjQ (UPF0145 family)